MTTGPAVSVRALRTGWWLLVVHDAAFPVNGASPDAPSDTYGARTPAFTNQHAIGPTAALANQHSRASTSRTACWAGRVGEFDHPGGELCSSTVGRPPSGAAANTRLPSVHAPLPAPASRPLPGEVTPACTGSLLARARLRVRVSLHPRARSREKAAAFRFSHRRQLARRQRAL